MQAEAGHQQGGAAGDAHHCHEEALFVEEQVAGGDLVGELQPPPHRADVLQQDALAGLGGLGQHQAGGLLPQLGPAGVQGGQQGAGHRRPRGQQAVVPVEGGQQFGQVVHDVVGAEDDAGEQLHADEHAHRAARQTGGQGVEDVLGGDLAAGVAQGLHGAHLAPLFLHHAGHGGQRHQRRHQEEEHREHRGDGGDLVGVVAVAGKAGVVAAVAQHPLALFDLAHFALGVQNFLFAVGQFLLGLGLGVLVFLFAVEELLPAFLQFGQPVLILPARIQQLFIRLREGLFGGGDGVVQFLLLGLELGPAVGKLLAPGVDLGLLFVQRRQRRVQGGALVRQRLQARFQLVQLFQLRRVEALGQGGRKAHQRLHLPDGGDGGFVRLVGGVDGGQTVLDEQGIDLGLHHGPEGGLALAQLVQLGAARVQLLLGVVQLLLGVQDLFLGVGDLLLVAGQQKVELVLVGVQLRLAVVYFHLGVRQLLLRVRQFRPAVLELLLRVGQFLFGLGLLVVVFRPGVVQLGFGIVDDLVVAGLHPLVLDGLKAVHHRAHLVLVGCGEGVQLPRALHREVEGGVVVHVEAGLGGIGEQVDGAGAGVGVFGLHREIGRRAHGAHHGEGLGQRVGDVLVVLGLVHRQHVPDGGDGAGKILGQAHGDLAGGRGHPPVHKGQLVELLLLGQAFFGDALKPGGQALAALAGEHQVHVPGGHDPFHPFHRPHGGQVLVGEALGGLYLDVIEVGLPAVGVGGKAHVHRRSQQAGEEAHAQRHDGKDGHKAGEACAHGAQDGLPVGTVQQRLFTTRSVPPAWGWDSSRWRWPARS